MSRVTAYILLLFTVVSCTVKYSFTGARIPPEAKTVSIPTIPNMAAMVTPTLSPMLTEALQDRFSRQTRLNVVRENGDLSFEGEITNYVSSSLAVVGNEYTAVNRLTITVRMKFTNIFEPENSFEPRTFSAYEDYSSSILLQDAESTLLPQIVDKLVNDIFNAAVSNW